MPAATDQSSPADQDEFTRLTEPFRQELTAYCYRMLGSVQDAEDQVQETLMRAWRSWAKFEGRASVRTWLYRIATNACLRAIEVRGRRPLPSALAQASGDPTGPPVAPPPEVEWLEPFPDVLLRADANDPASIVGSRHSIRLALVAALQYLPPRQHVVLILRDVLAWRAAEVAELLGTSVAAVNSALQRARDQLRDADLGEEEIQEPASPGTRLLLDKFVTAVENADVTAFIQLLTEDAVLEMPPSPAWFAGRDQLGCLLAAKILLEPRLMRPAETSANGQPAFAVYQRGAAGSYHAHSMAVLSIVGPGISRITAFMGAGFFPAFSMPIVRPPREGWAGLRVTPGGRVRAKFQLVGVIVKPRVRTSTTITSPPSSTLRRPA
jgi:RNA polymerase sigma-70 factor (ECF subfamily)